MAASVDLCPILDKLLSAELNRFRSYLSQNILEGFNPIPAGKLENCDVTGVVDKMKQIYPGVRHIRIAFEILKRVERIDLVEDIKTQLGTSTLHQQSGTAASRTNDDLTLDPNTAHRNLILSEGNRKVSHSGKQSHPDHPERFDPNPQVMSKEPLTGCCYWECEWYGTYAAIGVAYHSMDRSKWIKQCSEAWCLECHNGRYVANHNGWETPIFIPVSGSKRVGVFLDQQSGTLSFYRVTSEEHILLHTFRATFNNEPIHAVFNLNGASVCLVKNAFHLCPTELLLGNSCFVKVIS